jgi:hypothetical protein
MKQNQTEISKTGYGNLPENCKTGTRIKIGKHTIELVKSGKDDHDCPLYRFRYPDIVGNTLWDVDTLNQMGATMVDGQGELKI